MFFSVKSLWSVIFHSVFQSFRFSVLQVTRYCGTNDTSGCRALPKDRGKNQQMGLISGFSVKCK